MQSKWVKKEVVDAAASMGSPKKGMDSNYTALKLVSLKSFLYSCQAPRKKLIY